MHGQTILCIKLRIIIKFTGPLLLFTINIIMFFIIESVLQ